MAQDISVGGKVFLHTEVGEKNGKFARQEDDLKISDDTSVHNLTPVASALNLADGSSEPFAHHSCRRKEGCVAMEIRVEKKEQITMKCDLVMVREEDLDRCVDEDSSDSKGSGDADAEQMIRPFKTRMCFSAKNTAQKLKNVRVSADLFIKNFWNKYLTPWKDRVLLEETMSSSISIYLYQANQPDSPGSPVLLNITGTEHFFCCSSKDDDKKILQVVTRNKSDLKTICADDEDKWSLVFFMTSGPTNLRRFESALHRGWFIYTKSESCEVDMGTNQMMESCSYQFSY